MAQIKQLVRNFIAGRRLVPPQQLAPLVEAAKRAPFATDLLEADAPLNGTFWQFDVIAPGYRLPAVELALLRAVRLDESWPEATTVEQFVTDLQQAVVHPQAGVWAAIIAWQPCAIFVAPTATVIYCATTQRLHAGYRTGPAALGWQQGQRLRKPAFNPALVPKAAPDTIWLSEVLAQKAEHVAVGLTAQLDDAILRLRAGLQR